MNIADISARLMSFVTRNAPQIMAAIGVSSMVGAVVATAKTAPIASKRTADILAEPSTPKEKSARIIKEVAPLYVPTIALVGIGTLAIVRGQQLMTMRNIELTHRLATEITAYSAGKEAFEAYQKNVIARLGENEHKEIREQVASEVATTHLLPSSLTDIPGRGPELVYDCVMDKVFYASRDALEAAKGRMNEYCLEGSVATVSNFYTELGMDGCGIIGDLLGWDADPEHRPNLYIGTTTNPDGDVPKLAIQYDAYPLYEF